MNINECGCRPYEWLGLDGDRCIRVIPRQKQQLENIKESSRAVNSADRNSGAVFIAHCKPGELTC